MKKKILFVINDIDFFISHRLPLAIAARKKNFEVFICAPTELKKIKFLKKFGIKIIPIKLSRSNKNIFQDVILFISLYKIIKKLKPDILQLVTIKPLLYGGIISRILGIKLTIFSFSGLGHIYYSTSILIKKIALLILRFSISNNKKCVVFLQNRHNFNYLKKNKILKNNKICFTKGSGINLSSYKPSKKKFKKVTITLPSRMSSEKGVYEFVEASKKFYKYDKNINFILLGKFDPEGPSCIPLKLLKEYNNKTNYPNLRWIGYKKNIIDVINKSTIIVLPTYHEGVPKVLMEAAACGKPIIATNISGCREVVKQNKNGILIPPKNSFAIEKAIKNILQNKKKLKKMKKFSRYKALKEFDIKYVVKKHLNCYLSII